LTLPLLGGGSGASQEEILSAKRLRILSDEELEALYGRPRFTPDERDLYFTLTQSEQESLQLFLGVHAQLSFLLQVAYFKAKQRFFAFTLDEVEDDMQYALNRFFPQTGRPHLRKISRPTLLKQHDMILRLYQYRRSAAHERHQLAKHAEAVAKLSSKPIYIFRALLQFLSERRLIIPAYTVLQDIVGQAITVEEQRLAVIIQLHVTADDQHALDQLVADTDGLYTITRLKKAPKDFSLGEMRREIQRGEDLRPLYQLASRVLPALAISNEGVKYYASLVAYYPVFRLKQFDHATRSLYLLCFIFHRYQQLHDNLLTCFIHLVRTYLDEAKAVAKQTVYDYRVASNQDLPKAGLILKLLTTEQPRETSFEQVQAEAFAILDRSRLNRVADYIVTETAFDEHAFLWAHVDVLARRFKAHLRPILHQVDLAATRANAPIVEATQFLQATFAARRPLVSANQKAVPTRFLPVRYNRYLYAQEKTALKRLLPDRYEFLVYRLVRTGLEAGDLFCRESVRFRSFEDDLLDDEHWQHKTALIEQMGRPILMHPIQEHLADLEGQLEERIQAVNHRIDAGENTYFQLKGKGKRWTLQYPKGNERINHPLFSTLRQVNVGSLLHFVDQRCQFMACFEHIVGRSRKQARDERVISACLIAWGTNMGLGRMGDISDIAFDTLSRTSENVLRPETLKAANDCISNAIAALPIFRWYDLGDVIHSSSDGQKFETGLPTFNARESPKYFGLKKGVVAYSLIANHVPVNARIIGAHEHESHYVFDVLFNNTTGIQPVVHSTDTHGANQVNFALLNMFGYQFAPRYQAIQDKVRSGLYGFKHPKHYGDVVLKPIRKLNTALIVAEWGNLQRIFVSLGLKTTTQSIIVSKLSAYARKNKTRQAFWEYDNIFQSLYLLDFVDSASLRQNVQRALNRGENYHQLRRAVSYANFGKLRFRTEDEQQLWSECSRLITNAIIFYNATILSQLLVLKEATGDTAGTERLTQVSPVAWQHINFYGRYEFSKGPEPINVEAIVEVLAQHPLAAVEHET
jgi:TnpA family transposase